MISSIWSISHVPCLLRKSCRIQLVAVGNFFRLGADFVRQFRGASTLPFVTLLTITCVNSFVEFWILCTFLWCRGEVHCNGAGKLVDVAHNALFLLFVVYFWILCIVLWYRGRPNCKGRFIVGECMSRLPITFPPPLLCDCSCFRRHHMSSPLLSSPLNVACDWPCLVGSRSSNGLPSGFAPQLLGRHT